MRGFSFALLTVLLGATLAAQSTARIEGRVVDQSGQPVRKATVLLRDSPAPSQPVQPNAVVEISLAPSQPVFVELSDSDGHFTLENLPAGRFMLSAGRPGFVMPNTPTGILQITLRAGEMKRNVEVKVIAQAAITGHVLDQDGDPVPNARVRIIRFHYQDGREQIQYAAAGTADDLGSFRVGNITAGRYFVVADDPHFTEANDPRARIFRNMNERVGRSAQENNVTTYYPSGSDAETSVALSLVPGAELRGVDIHMRRARVFAIRGKVAGSEGQPSSLRIFPKGDGPMIPGDQISGGLDTDGVFGFDGLLPGTYTLLVLPDGSYRAANGEVTRLNRVGRMEVNIGNADLEGVVFPLSPAAEITGTITMDDGDLPPLRPAVGIISRARIYLSEFRDFGVGHAAQINEDGTFRIPNIGPSKFFVHVSVDGPPGTHVKSLRFGGQDITNTPLDLTSGSGGVLSIVLSQKSAELNVTARDSSGDSVTAVRMTLWQKPPRVHEQGGGIRDITSLNGTIHLSSLQPGDYFLAAWEDIDPNLLQNPEFLALFESQATPLKLSENSKETVDLKLIPRDKILAAATKLP